MNSSTQCYVVHLISLVFCLYSVRTADHCKFDTLPFPMTKSKAVQFDFVSWSHWRCMGSKVRRAKELAELPIWP